MRARVVGGERLGRDQLAPDEQGQGGQDAECSPELGRGGAVGHTEGHHNSSEEDSGTWPRE